MRKMTPSERGRVAGLASARANDNKAKGARGGNATLDKYGREHFLRMSLRKAGVKVTLATEVKE